MKSKLTKLISLAMALTLVMSMAACGGNNDETTTAPETTNDVVVDMPTNADEETTAAEENSAEATEATTAIVTDGKGNSQVVTQAPTKAPAKPTKAPAKPTQAPTKPAAADEKLPTDKAALMKMFNDKKFTSAKMTRRLTSGKISALRGAINLDLSNEKAVQDSFNKNNAKIAVGNTKLTSVTSAKATGTMKNGTITFTLPNINRAVANTINHGHKGYLYFIDLKEAEVVANNIIAALASGSATVEGDKSYITLSGGKIVATVKDGKVVSAKYSFSEHVTAKARYRGLPATADISGTGSVIYS